MRKTKKNEGKTLGQRLKEKEDNLLLSLSTLERGGGDLSGPGPFPPPPPPRTKYNQKKKE
jgi:hypothetical protein